MTGLTRQERIERGQANRKAREELRNAVRFAMTQDGVSPSQIKDAAKDMAREAAAVATKALTTTGTFEALVRKVVREECNAMMRGEPSMSLVISNMIKEEAARYGKEFIEKNVIVNITKESW
ncbi:MAG: hypothetical protein WKG03_08925 [Telluria sp.]